MSIDFEERLPYSRPFRSGTRRRRPGRAAGSQAVASAAGASWPARRPASLDTGKQLETSDFEIRKAGGKTRRGPINCRQWLKDQKTAPEEWREALQLHGQLLRAVESIMYRHRKEVLEKKDTAAIAWMDFYNAQQRRLEGETGAQAYQRVKKWLKANKPTGPTAEWLKWEKAYFAISNCGKEYIGWKAACCGERTQAIAVPIGCNHRLCPMCAWRRSQTARVRVKSMFDRLKHPVLVTLTMPNIPAKGITLPNGKTAQGLRKKDFEWFRKRVRAWMAQRTVAGLQCSCGHGRDEHKEIRDGKLRRTLGPCRVKDSGCQGWDPVPVVEHEHKFTGGIYAIETTYNRREKTWHLHAHVLADMNYALPSKFTEEGGKRRLNRVDFYEQKVLAFTSLKWRMEFDWLLLTGGAQDWGSRPKNEAPKKSYKAIAKWRKAWENYWFSFESWVKAKRKHSTIAFKSFDGQKWQRREDLRPDEMRRYKELERWNARNTRVFHIQPVTDREGAAREVLKYLTKVADFSDRPEAVEEFCNATRGARMVQTFGTWYGLSFDADFDPNHLEDWGKRPECACGMNHWEKTGVYHSQDVEMNEAGRFLLKASVLKHDHGGTVVRPRIRADHQRRE